VISSRRLKVFRCGLCDIEVEHSLLFQNVKNTGDFEMADWFRNYDRWKLMSPEDEADERERQRLKAEDDMERADVMRDREKDERYERCGSDENETPCDACSMTESFLNRSVELLKRYRNETPPGHQPHMICGEVDSLLLDIENDQIVREFLSSGDKK